MPELTPFGLLVEGFIEQPSKCRTVHTVGTDHGARSREEKLHPALSVITRREGVSNVQVYRPMLYSEGVRTGRITVGP